ncbi:MAG: ATP-binding protein [Desulfomonile sp.]|nr:ATP-binding protein [Desulfomonile sp.]
MRELVIISGKGGTGKTSLTASFACLAADAVLVDCDVDAADLHILVHPEVKCAEEFRGGVKAIIDRGICTECAACREVCRFNAIDDSYVVNPVSCEGCGVCFHVCPEKAVELEENLCGRWFVSETRFGPMVHAALFPGEENSGKLVALVRNQAKVIARREGKSLILVDGAPGVGCPVISSVTGADHVLVVAEPSLSGLHDLERVCKLVSGFRIPISVVVNKRDINPLITERIEASAGNHGAQVLGTVPYDDSVIKAMVQRRAVVENGLSAAGNAVREIWDRVKTRILS